jgi:hypothetical protein
MQVYEQLHTDSIKVSLMEDQSAGKWLVKAIRDGKLVVFLVIRENLPKHWFGIMKKLLKLKSDIEKARETMQEARLHKEMMRLLGEVQKLLSDSKED